LFFNQLIELDIILSNKSGAKITLNLNKKSIYA
jgi:hypothetical protein